MPPPMKPDLALSLLVAVQVVDGGAGAADADELVGLHGLVEEQRDAVQVLVRVVAADGAGRW
jgi:hypothetical protein